MSFAFRRRLPSSAVVAYVGGMSTLALLVLDDKLHLRQWTHRSHVIRSEAVDIQVNIRSRVRAGEGEAGQGCVDWPAGRVLLQWAIDGGVPSQDAQVLEIGAGCGLTSIGCALAAGLRAGRGTPTSFVATDVCAAALSNARDNAAAAGAPLTIAHWDAAGGLAAVDRLPISPASLTHVIGADLVSAPVLEKAPSGGAEDEAQHGDGLEGTLAALLRTNPRLRITLVLTNRCAGGAVSALAAQAGVHDVGGVTYDPALVRFERRCARLGLAVERHAIPPDVAQRVSETQPLLERAQWYLADVWSSLLIYNVSLSERE